MKVGVTLRQAIARNLGTCCFDVKGEFRVGDPHEGESTDAGHRGGVTRSRGEGAVMALDRRGYIVWALFGGQPVMGGAE